MQALFINIKEEIFLFLIVFKSRLLRFDEDKTFEFPNATDANRVTYSYKKGESLSNAREIASLRDIVNRHLDVMFNQIVKD